MITTKCDPSELGGAIVKARDLARQREDEQEQNWRHSSQELIKSCENIAEQLVPELQMRIIDSARSGGLSCSISGDEFRDLLGKVAGSLNIDVPEEDCFVHAVASALLREINQSLEMQEIKIIGVRHDQRVPNADNGEHGSLIQPLNKFVIDKFEFNWDPSYVPMVDSPPFLQMRKVLTEDIGEILEPLTVPRRILSIWAEITFPRW